MKESNCNRRSWFASAGVLALSVLAANVSLGDVFYVADEARLVKISPDGVPTVLIKSGERG